MYGEQQRRNIILTVLIMDAILSGFDVLGNVQKRENGAGAIF